MTEADLPERTSGDVVALRPAVLPSRSSVFSALRHRNFRLFYYGFVVSLIGVWMDRVAQSWLVLELTDSPFYVGLVNALSSMPVLVFSLYAGHVADRVSKRNMVVVTQAGAMLVALILAVLVFGHRVTIAWVMVLAAALGLVTAFDIPARQSFFVELVGKDDLMNAIALNSSAFNASRVVGPAIAGVLIGAVGMGMCFLLNGLSFIGVIWALFRMDLPATRRSTEPVRAWSNIVEGLRYIAGDVRLRMLVINMSIFSIFGLPLLTLLPVLAKSDMGKGAVEFGWMMSAVGLGALAGALWIASGARRIRKGTVLGYAATGFGVLVIAVAYLRVFWLVLVLLAATGAAMIITSAITNTLLQTIAPDHLRGRVVSVYTFAFVGMSPIGSIVGGWAAERFGTGATLAAGGVVTVLAAIMLVMRTPELRQAA
jgi:MFS family permease